MSVPPEHQRFSIEEYLRRERTSPDKHEYRDGQIVMMAGGSVSHSRIISNTIRSLGNRLEGTPCEVFESNLRIVIPRKSLYTYADAMVICGGVNRDASDSTGGTATNPRVIIEVLSPSTEAYDRGEKFDLYREIQSLKSMF